MTEFARIERTLRWFPMRTGALIGASVVFVLNTSVAIHELGHLVADQLSGLDAHLLLHVLRSSSTVIEGGAASDIPIVAVAAGPLANLGLGVVISLGLWSMRRPVLLPLLLWGPIAVLQESITALVQLAGNEPGTDFVLMRRAGLPGVMIPPIAAIAIGVALWAVLVLMAVAGVDPKAPLGRRIGVLTIGMSGYTLLLLLGSLALGYPSSDVARNSGLAVLFVGLSVSLAAIYGPWGRRRQPRIHLVERRTVAVASMLAVASSIPYLVF